MAGALARQQTWLLSGLRAEMSLSRMLWASAMKPATTSHAVSPRDHQIGVTELAHPCAHVCAEAKALLSANGRIIISYVSFSRTHHVISKDKVTNKRENLLCGREGLESAERSGEGGGGGVEGGGEGRGGHDAEREQRQGPAGGAGSGEQRHHCLDA
eukprot:2600255-Rhodomonas_salina.1